MSYTGLLINTCDIIQRTFDKWNEPSETTQNNIKCRYMRHHKLIRNIEGEEILSTGKFFFDTSVSIGHEDIIRFNGTKYSIVEIRKVQNSAALHHIEVYVK